MKHTYINWIIEYSIAILITIGLTCAVFLLYTFRDFSRLGKIYNRNWGLNPLTNIAFVQPDLTCPPNYQKTVIGTWSGFQGGCICVTSNGQLFSSSENDCDKYKDSEDISACTAIPTISPVNITSYKGYDICVQRAEFDFHDLYHTFKDIMNYTLDEINLAGKMEGSKFTYDVIRNLITDVKIVNATLFPLNELRSFRIDLQEYTTILIKKDYYLLIKRFMDEDDQDSVLINLRKVVTDVHLFNEIWCSYRDLSVPFDISLFQPHVDFGFESCNSMMQDDSDGLRYYNTDNPLAKTLTLSGDPSISAYDFYSQDIINSYVELIGNLTSRIQVPALLNSRKKEIVPALVYENYLPGLGCSAMATSKEHISVNLWSRNLYLASIVLVSITLGAFAFVLFLILAKKLQKKRLFIVVISIISILCFIGFIVSAGMTARFRSSYGYFKKFQLKCQVDGSDVTNTIELERKYIDSLSSSIITSSINASFLFISLYLGIIYLWKIIYRDKEDVKKAKRQYAMVKRNDYHAQIPVQISEDNGSYQRKQTKDIDILVESSNSQ